MENIEQRTAVVKSAVFKPGSLESLLGKLLLEAAADPYHSQRDIDPEEAMAIRAAVSRYVAEHVAPSFGEKTLKRVALRVDAAAIFHMGMYFVDEEASATAMSVCPLDFYEATKGKVLVLNL